MGSTASVIEQTVSKVRFCVDDVELAQQRLPVRNAKLRLEECFGKPLLAFSHDGISSIVQSHHTHPLAQAVHAAFSDHRPLLLTPDIVWITLAQGFAQHINNHAETLRSRFVAHQGKKRLVVESFEIPTSLQQWNESIQQWTLLIRDHVGADLYRLLECNFSTTTPITHTASHVVMMDTFQAYFEYELSCVCGIPEITLEGTVEDWKSIYTRVQWMTQYELGWWTNRILPICQEFIETASGKPSLEFWQAIYKPKEVYGGDVITGWLADLFPYLKHHITQATSVKNPILSIDHANIRIENGISPRSLPLGLSQVPCKLKTSNGENYSLALVGGFIGVSQTKDGSLHPEIGWAVLEKEDDRFTELLDKIEQEHITQPPINWNNFQFGFLDSLPKELIQLLDRFDGATLYANSHHAWKVTNNSSARIYAIPAAELFPGLDEWDYNYAVHFIELADGRCVAHCMNWIVVGKPIKRTDAKPGELCQSKLEDVVIIAKSFSDLFERIFAAGGLYYFDAPDFSPILVDGFAS